MLKIIFIPKKECIKNKSGQYLLPKSVLKGRALGAFKYMNNIKTKKPIISRHMDIYVACGNGWLTFVTLVHECCHYINARFLNHNDKFTKWIEKWL